MKKFQLFSEWRNITVWGSDLGDALKRRGALRRPDTYAGGVKIEDGESEAVAEILQIKPEDKNSTRGDKPYQRALVEFDDGRIEEVDGVLIESI